MLLLCIEQKRTNESQLDSVGSAGSLYEVPLWSSPTDSWRWPSRTPPPLYRSVWPPPGSWKGRTGFCCPPPAVSGPTAPGWTCCWEESDIWQNSCKLQLRWWTFVDPHSEVAWTKCSVWWLAFCLAVSLPKSCRFDTDTETPPWNPLHMFVSWTSTSRWPIWGQNLSFT